MLKQIGEYTFTLEEFLDQKDYYVEQSNGWHTGDTIAMFSWSTEEVLKASLDDRTVAIWKPSRIQRFPKLKSSTMTSCCTSLPASSRFPGVNDKDIKPAEIHTYNEWTGKTSIHTRKEKDFNELVHSAWKDLTMDALKYIVLCIMISFIIYYFSKT